MLRRYVGLTLYVHVQGRFCLYKLTEDEKDAWDDDADTGLFRVSRGIPSNNSVQVLIRVYIVSVRPHFKSFLLMLVDVLNSSSESFFTSGYLNY